MNYRGLLPSGNNFTPCWTTAVQRDGKNYTQYTDGDETKERECYFSSLDDFQQKMNMKLNRIVSNIIFFIHGNLLGFSKSGCRLS